MIPFPLVWDDSMLAEAKACRHKFWLKYLNHWKPVGSSIHLHAGKCFASALEVARKTYFQNRLDLAPPDRAAEAEALAMKTLLSEWGDPKEWEDEVKSLPRMMGALEFYFERYPLHLEAAEPTVLPSGKRAIEMSSVDPLDIAHPETGEPLLYSTRADQWVDWADGVFVCDDKTTSSLGASWSQQWDLRAQFTGYTWAARKTLGPRVRGILIRGISILKTKYDTQQAVTYRADWEIDEWYQMTLDLLQSLIIDWKRNVWRKDLSKSCADWGGCEFRSVCKVQDPTPWLNQYFERKFWNPVTRTETKL